MNEKLIPIGKFMVAHETTPNSNKWMVFSKSNQSFLGYIEYYPRWKCLVFAPASGISYFSEDCLSALSRFMREHEKGQDGIIWTAEEEKL